MARWWEGNGTEVLFAPMPLPFIFTSEQFWGRAARAPETRNESGRSLSLPAIAARSESAESIRAASLDTALVAYFQSSVIRSPDREIHCDASLRRHRLPILIMGFEAPLPDRCLRRIGQDRRTAHHAQSLDTAILPDPGVQNHFALDLHLTGQ